MTIDQTQAHIESVLCDAPREAGEFRSYNGKRSIHYEVRLLPPGRIDEIKIERNAYLAERGVSECTPTTAELYDSELRLRVCADAILRPGTDEPLQSIDNWRRSSGPALDHCIRHYTQLEVLEDPTDMELAALLPVVEAHVKKNSGPGTAAFWRTIDYETLLACFVTLVLRRDESPS